MRTPLPWMTVLPLVVVIGCGMNQPPPTVYVTVPQAVAKVGDANAKSRPTQAAVTSGKNGEPKVDEKAERLKRIDKDALADLRRGNWKESLKAWSEVTKEYENTKPEDCTVGVSFQIAIIKARVVYLLARANRLEDRITSDLGESSQKHAIRAGIAEDKLDAFFAAVRQEMNEATPTSK